MKTLSAGEIKKCELDILLEFDGFCKKNNMDYCLCGGTLLGAIRHKGFIPWDDDIDVLMPRNDYERLLNNNFKESLHFPYELKHWRNNTLPIPFVKVVNSQILVQENYVQKKYRSNLWIDVFPIDGNPKDEQSNRKLYKKSLFLRKLLRAAWGELGNGTTLYKKIGKILLRPFLNILGINRLCEAINQNALTYKYDDCELIGGVLWGYGPQERIRKKEFIEKVEVTFEEYRFPAPSNYHEYLSNLYGDYMTLPPKDKQIAHDFLAWRKESED